MNRLDRAFRTKMAALRAEILRRVEADWRIDETDIASSVEAFIAKATPKIIAGQATAQTLATAYVAALVEAATDTRYEPLPPDPDIVGTNTKGVPFKEAMAAIGPVILGRIGDGAPVDEAIGTGLFLVSSLADNEVTAASDQEADRQAEAADAIVGWEGVVQPGSCDGCMDNEGVHDLDEEMYRHPGCDCEKTWVLSA